MAKIAVEHVFGSTVVPLVPLSSPENVAVTNFGTPGATTYTYHVTAYNSAGETIESTVVTTTGNATLSGSNFNRITWDKVWGATGYKIYNGLGNILSSATLNLHFDDVGGVTTDSSLPIKNTTGYNPVYTSAGSLMYQSGGAIGPQPVKVARPRGESTAFEVIFPSVIPWSPTVDWVFLIEGGSAAATRRIMLYEFDRSNNTFTWKGYVTITFPPVTNHTVRGFAMSYEVYTTGTVAVSGTAVTGTGTSWSTNRMKAGSRIGFGSTDPNQISTWYEISSIGSDTSITLTGSAGTISANSVYCIEDLEAVISTTNATAANGGLFVAKGLKYENFVSGGTTISAASTTDNVRAVYWLADAASVTNTVVCGNALDDKESWTTQYVYCLDTTATPKVYKYNIRAALSSLSSGKSTSSFAYVTGTQTVTGTTSQQNNGEIIDANHGPGKGEKSLYFVTTTRIYRAVISEIVNGSTVWIEDCMVEIPPGGAPTFPATSVFAYIEHLDFIDDFVIYTTGATSFRSYVTDYNTYVPAFESIIGVDSKQLDQASADANSTPHPSIGVSPLISWNEEGISYVLRQNTSATLNHLYAVPLSACYTHTWQDGREQYVITPALPTPNGARLYRVYINQLLAHGGSDAFAIVPEAVKVWYRVNGIHDDSGAWSLLPDSGDLAGVETGQDIQLRLAFKVCGMYQLPSKVYSVCAIYETDADIPSHLQWNVGDTSSTTGIVGFIQKGTYGSVPDLQITYYRVDTDDEVLTQASTGSTYGTFEYWDGDSWEAGLGTDTNGIRRRFRPTVGILTGVNVYCKLKTI